MVAAGGGVGNEREVVMVEAAGGTLSKVVQVSHQNMKKESKSKKLMTDRKALQPAGIPSSQSKQIKMVPAQVSARRRALELMLVDSVVTYTDLGSRH